MLAAQKGDAKIVETLIKNGADVNITNSKNGATALIIAANDGHVKVVEVLLKNNADVNIKAGNGMTALDAAKYGKNQSIIKMLLEAGVK